MVYVTAPTLPGEASRSLSYRYALLEAVELLVAARSFGILPDGLEGEIDRRLSEIRRVLDG